MVIVHTVPYHNGNRTDSMFFFIPTDFLGLGWRSTMDERNQGLCSEPSAVWNNQSCNAVICPAVLATCCNSGSFRPVLCIQFLLYPTHTDSADSSRKVYNCLWPYSHVSRYWKPAGTTIRRFVHFYCMIVFFPSKEPQVPIFYLVYGYIPCKCHNTQ